MFHMKQEKGYYFAMNFCEARRYPLIKRVKRLYKVMGKAGVP